MFSFQIIRIPSAENNVNRTAARRLNRSNAKAKKAAAEQTTSAEATPEVTNEGGKRNRTEAESSTSAASAQPAKKARLSSTVHIQETNTPLSETLPPHAGQQPSDDTDVTKTATLMDIVQQDEDAGSKEVTDALLAAEELGLEQAVDAISKDDVVNME